MGKGRAHGPDPRKDLVRHVGQAELWHATFGQGVNHGLCLGNDAGEHVPPPGFPGMDLVGIVGEGLQQGEAILGKGDAEVVANVPDHVADIRKEPVTFGRILKDLGIERARVPAHDDITDIPENRLGHLRDAPVLSPAWL